MQYRMTNADRGAARDVQPIGSPRRLRVGAGWLVLILVSAAAPLAASADTGGGPLCVVPAQSLAMGDSEDDHDDEAATDERDEDDEGQPGPETLFMPSPPEQFNQTAQARLNAIEDSLQAAERANRQHSERAGAQDDDDDTNDDAPVIGEREDDDADDEDDARTRAEELDELRARFATVREALDQADAQEPETLAVYQAAVDAQLTQLEEDLGRFRGSIPAIPAGEEPEIIDEPTPPEY
jgi:hypothetical protein